MGLVKWKASMSCPQGRKEEVYLLEGMIGCVMGV